jgi:hypothetical protein
MIKVVVLALALAIPVVAAAGPKKKIDWKARVHAVTFAVPDEKVLDWAGRVEGYDVVMVHKSKVWPTELELRIEQTGGGGKVLYTWDGHWETPIVVVGDTLYYSDHSAIASGASIVKVDLTTGKRVWTARLQGLGPIDHSRYRNRVRIEVGADVVTVHGEEAEGNYVELVDVASGKTLASEKR